MEEYMIGELTETTSNVVHDSHEILLGQALPVASNSSPNKLFEGSVYADDTISCLVFPTRFLNYCGREGVDNVAGIVSKLDKLDGVRGMGAGSAKEVRELLFAAAGLCDSPLSSVQLGVLRSVSSCRKLSFDMYGCLIVLPIQKQSESDPLANRLIVNLHLPDPVKRRLELNGIENVGALNSCGLEGLEKIPHLGKTSIKKIVDAVSDLYSSSDAPLPDWCGGPVEQIDVSDYLESLGVDVRRVLDELWNRLVDRSYPLFRSSFAVFMGEKARALIEDGHSSDRAVSTLFDEIEKDSKTLVSCEHFLVSEINRQRENIGGSFVEFMVPDGEVWDSAASSVVSRFEGTIDFDYDARLIRTHRYPIDEWLAQLDERQASMLRMRFEGSTLQEVGDELSVTRERVRQVCDKAFDKRPALRADEYRLLTDRYAMSPSQFVVITGLDEADYHYLKMTSKTKASQLRPLSQALDDTDLSSELRDTLADQAMFDDILVVDGVRVPLNKGAIVSYILKSHQSDGPMSEHGLFELYCSFIASNNLSNVSKLDPTSERAFCACLDRFDDVMDARVPNDDAGERRGVRYYKASGYDFAPLRAAVASISGMNIECSTALLTTLDPIARLLEAFDIQNEYELHYVLSRWCAPIENVTFSRVPMLTLGHADRTVQILGVIKDIGPADIFEISQEYARRYGVRESTFRGSFLNGFERYCRNGLYSVESIDLSDEQEHALGEILERATSGCSVAMVESEFKRIYPEWHGALLTDEVARTFGRRLDGGIIMVASEDSHVFFAQLIAKHDRFRLGEGDFSQEVISAKDFVSELHKAERSFSIIEIADGEYLSIRAFENAPHPVDADMMRACLSAAIEKMEPRKPYGTKDLRGLGVFDALANTMEDLGLDDYVLRSIMMQGYVGGHLKRTSIKGVPVFCKGVRTFSVPNLMVWLLERCGSMTVGDMSARIYDGYGASFLPTTLRTYAKGNGIGFDPLHDLLFSRAPLDSESRASAVSEQLSAFFDATSGSVLLWHDTSRAYAGILDSIELPEDVVLIREDRLGCSQALRELNNLGLDERALFYRTSPHSVDSRDWFVDIEAHAETFHPVFSGVEEQLVSSQIDAKPNTVFTDGDDAWLEDRIESDAELVEGTETVFAPELEPENEIERELAIETEVKPEPDASPASTSEASVATEVAINPEQVPGLKASPNLPRLEEPWYPIEQFALLAGCAPTDAFKIEYFAYQARYTVYSDCAFSSSFESLYECYLSLMKGAVVDVSSLPSVLAECASFKQFVYRALRQGDLFAYDDSSWVTQAGLADLEITTRDLYEFAEGAVSHGAEDGMPYFTVPWLKRKVSNLSLLEYELSDRFYESVLSAQDELLASGTMAGVKFFAPRGYSMKGCDFICSIVAREVSIDLDDLVDDLEHDYGIVMTRAQLSQLVRKAGLFYSPEFDRVYIDHERFVLEVE